MILGCDNEWITSDFMFVSLHTLASLNSFHLVERIFNRQALVQNVHIHIAAATVSPGSEARNEQTNTRNGYLNPRTQFCLWSIACFCNVAQVDNEREEKVKKPNKPTVFSDLRDSLLSWRCSALSLFSWTFDQNDQTYES